MKRGAFIVIEGVDRTGKSTQCKALVENLIKKQVHAKYINFPDRSTDIGKTINSYLTCKTNISDESIHLLFSANRWERVDFIKKTLEKGITLVVDRYCYSGVAFSAAKGLDIDWCKSPDSGLPRPDKVFFFTLPVETVVKRNGFGNERYETTQFQNKVSNTYNSLVEDNWDIIDASRSIEEIQEQILNKTLNLINEVGSKAIEKIWMKS